MSRQILRSAPAPKGQRATMDMEVVLVFLEHNKLTPFVTWCRNIADGDTYWGHYFQDYKSAEDDFKERAVKYHCKIRKPFNLEAHYNLVAQGFMLMQHDSDFEDIGDAESGPHLTGGPAFDEYIAPDYRIYIDTHGEVINHEPRDLAREAYEESMA